MPPKTQFTREQIIDAAFEIGRELGLDNITVRKVAEKLGSSIAPIYVNFQSVDELVLAVVYRIVTISNNLLANQDTGNPFKDMGAASLRFANQYPQLFRDMVLKPNTYLQDYDRSMGSVLLDQMKKDADLAGFSEDEMLEILLKMRIFQLGLSVMMANRLMPNDYSEDQAIQLLHNMAADVITGARLRKNK